MGAIAYYYFGWPQGQVYSNLIASAICAALVWWRLHKQGIRQHAEAVAQAARHHAEKLEQGAAQHAELKRLHERRHEQLVGHVTAVGAHTAMSAVAVPQQILDDIRNAPERKPGGDPP